MKRLLAVASGGGHWKQLMLISPAFKEYRQKFVTTIDGLPQESGIDDFSIVKDSNKTVKVKVLITLIQIAYIVFMYRPHIIVTTGAAPGLLALLVGRCIGSKTIWVDSIANGQELSMGGRLSRKFAHKVYSQWPAIAKKEHIEYIGSVF